MGWKQRRFIVWRSVPAGLETEAAVGSWPAEALPEAARLVLEHLLARSRADRVERLAHEVEASRTALLAQP